MGNSFLYRMPAGIPGDVTRPSTSTIEAQILDSAAPPSEYGVFMKVHTNEKVRPVGSGDAAAACYGLLVRAYPTTSSQDPIGTATPPTSGPCDILVRGYMTVKLRAGTAVKNGPVYVRVAAAASGKPIGGIEAAADSTNTIQVPNCIFMGGADAGGNVEIRFNI